MQHNYSPDERFAHTELEMLRSELQNLRLMLDASVDCIKVVDGEGYLVDVNRAGRMALGIPLDDFDFGVTRMRWLDLLPPQVRARGRRAFKAATAGRKATFAGYTQLPGHDVVHWSNILTPIIDEHGAVTRVLCLARDVTRQRDADDKLRIAARTDELTGLGNRRAFTEQMSRLTRQLHDPTAFQQFGILLIDVDNLKAVNDIYGHQAGDSLLKGLAVRISKTLTQPQTLARLGGDEFAVALPEVSEPATLVEVAGSIHAALVAPISCGQMQLTASVSIGAALSSSELNTYDALVAASDTALYAAKAAGKRQFRLFGQHLDHTAIPTSDVRGWRSALHPISFLLQEMSGPAAPPLPGQSERPESAARAGLLEVRAGRR